MDVISNNNPNHPKKGSSISVVPIRDPKDRDIKRLLQDRPRDLLLFVMGINNGFLRLRVGDVRALKPGMSVKVREGNPPVRIRFVYFSLAAGHGPSNPLLLATFSADHYCEFLEPE